MSIIIIGLIGAALLAAATNTVLVTVKDGYRQVPTRRI